MKKMLPILVISGIVVTGLVVGLTKGQELKQRRRARRNANPWEGRYPRRGDVRLDEYEVSSWHD